MTLPLVVLALTGSPICNRLIFTSYTLAYNVVSLAIITAAFFIMQPLHDVTTSTYIASHILGRLRGRITSLTRLIVLSSFSLGYVIVGFSPQFFSGLWTISIFSALLLTVALTASFHPAIRHASWKEKASYDFDEVSEMFHVKHL
jgi:hypothetical protein